MNASSIALLVLLVLILGLVIRKMVRDKKAGRSSCGCGCSSCPMSGSCHGAKKTGQTAEKEA